MRMAQSLSTAVPEGEPERPVEPDGPRHVVGRQREGTDCLGRRGRIPSGLFAATPTPHSGPEP